MTQTQKAESSADSYRVTRVVGGKKVFEQFAGRAELVAAMSAVGIAQNGVQMPHEMVSPRLAGEPMFDDLAGPFLSRDGIRYEAWDLQ